MSQSTQIDIPTQTREASIVPATYNEADASVEVIWTTGIRRRAYDWMTDQVYDEELVVDTAAVDMTRFDAGSVQVLDGHRAYGGTDAILGIATRGWIANGEGRAQIKLRTSTPELAATAADVKAGLIRAISFGYSVQRYEITRAQDRTDGGTVPLYRATRWTPQEISFVAVPADPHAGTRSQHPSHPCEFVRADAQPQENPMTQAPPSAAGTTAAAVDTDAQRAAADAATRAAVEAARAAEATRAADITALCARHGVPTLAEQLIREAVTVDAAKGKILDHLATRDAGSGGHLNVRGIETVRDEVKTRMDGITEAIQHRLDPQAKISDNARQFRGMSMLEIGRDYLQSRGVDTRGWDRMRLATEMLHFRGSSGFMATSDFASILANVANKRLRGTYDENPGTYQMWARRAPNAPDFKTITIVQLSGMPDLLKTNEHGEFKYGTLKDGAETYSVATYGIIVPLSRQAIVNDDLRAFDRMVTGFGYASRRIENRLVYSILTTNAAMGDGVALFSGVSGARTQANVQSGGGSALQFTSLATGRQLMRVMKGLNGEELNIVPSYLIVPSALEQAAYQLTSPNYVPATSGAINEFRTGGRTALEPIVEPVLDADSATKWYLAASTGQVDTVEYCYLDGAEGAVIESDIGFDIDGMSMKCRLDFGAKAVDFRGLHRSAGA